MTCIYLEYEKNEIGQIGVSRNKRWGKLKEAATRKADEGILIQIAEKDMIAVEVKYHKCCHEKYALFLRHSVQSTGEENEKQVYKHEKLFDVFCKDFVIERLIKQDNIYYMRKLKKKFIKTVQHV